MYIILLCASTVRRIYIRIDRFCLYFVVLLFELSSLPPPPLSYAFPGTFVRVGARREREEEITATRAAGGGRVRMGHGLASERDRTCVHRVRCVRVQFYTTHVMCVHEEIKYSSGA